MDPYKILRIHSGASENEIEEAASRMLNIWNPDEFEEYQSVAQKVSRDINRAKNMLLDPKSRIIYDKTTKHGEEILPEVAVYTSSGYCVKYKRPWVSCNGYKGRQTNDGYLNNSNQTALCDFNFELEEYEQYFEDDLSLGRTQKFPSDNVICDSNDSKSDEFASGGNIEVKTCRSDSTFELEKYQEPTNSSLMDSIHDIENYLWMENTDTTYILKGIKTPRQSYTSKSDTFLLTDKDKIPRNKNSISSNINISLFDSYVVVKDDLMKNKNDLDPDYIKEIENFVRKSQSNGAILFRDRNLKVENRNQTKSVSDEKMLSINNTNNRRDVSPTFTYIINKDDLQNKKYMDSGSENEKEMTNIVDNFFSDCAISSTKSNLKIKNDHQRKSASDEMSLNINNTNNDRNVSPSFTYISNRDNFQDSGSENEKEMPHTVNDCFTNSAISCRDRSLKNDCNTQMDEFEKYYINKYNSSDEIKSLGKSSLLENKRNINGRLCDIDLYKTKKNDKKLDSIKPEKSNSIRLNFDQNVSKNKDLLSNHKSSDQNKSNNLKKNEITDCIKGNENLDLYIKGLKTSLPEICLPKHNVKEYIKQPENASEYFDVKKITKKQKHASDTDLLNLILIQSREIGVLKTQSDNKIHQTIIKENSVHCTKMTDTDDLENTTESFGENLTKSVSDSNTKRDENQKKRSSFIENMKRNKDSVSFENVRQYKVNNQTENDTDYKEFVQEEFEIPVIFKKNQIKETDCKALKTSLQSKISKEPPHYIINKITTDKCATASLDFVGITANSFSSDQRTTFASTDIQEIAPFSDIYKNSNKYHHHVQTSKSENEIMQKDRNLLLKIRINQLLTHA